MEMFLKITAGVFLGGLLALVAHDEIQEARAKYALEKMTQQAQAEIEAGRKRAEQQNLLIRKGEEVRRLDEEQASQVRSLAAAQETTARLVARQAADAKERAFDRFFVPTDRCRTDPASVDCGNAYIRARAQFERQYRPGY